MRGKTKFQKNAASGEGISNSLCLEGGDGKSLVESFLWRDMSKNVYFQFFDSQSIFSSNLNPTNLKKYPSHGEIYKFEPKLNKNSGEK